MRATGDLEPSRDADELIDFTCATPWERLALDIELELRAWRLSDAALPKPPVAPTPRHADASTSSISPVPLAASRLALGPKQLRLELRDAPSNHWLHSHPLERLFDISTHLMLSAPASDSAVADDPSAAAVLLSALTVAAAACGCTLPLVVPVGRPSSLRFAGRSLQPSPRRFTCDFTNSPSPDHTHLAGLLALFRNKRAAARRNRAPPRTASVHIAAHFNYNWTDFSFRLAPATPDGLQMDRRLSAAHAAALAEADPVRRMRLSAVWDRFPASDLQRNAQLAAMPAGSASRLRVSPPRELIDAMRKPAPRARAPLAAPARQALRLAQRAMQGRGAGAAPAAPLPLVDIAGSLAVARLSKEHVPVAPPSREDGMSPRIAPIPGSTALDGFLDQVSLHVTSSATHDDRIDEEFITSALAALFDMDLGRGVMVDVVDALGPNAAELDLLERIARIMGGTDTLASAQKLWNLFLDGIEVHWEMMWLVAGIPFSMESGPDHNESLILQKLQMINCCVERVRREKAGMSVSPHGGDVDGKGRKAVLPGVELIGSDDFVDSCQEDNWSDEDDRVWEPYVQPHPLVTRDMVEEELQRMVMRAENSGRSDETEAKRQSLTLKSDMSAFKAANPEASLADFVRWFSPSDWVTSEDDDSAIKDDSDANQKSKPRTNGRLSARMSREGNVWEELWREAEPVCAAEQVPLFDAAAHGNKALADLRAMGLSDVLGHMAMIVSGRAANLLHAAFQRPPSVPDVESRIEKARLSVREVCARSGLALGSGPSVLAELSASVEQTVAAEHSALVVQSVLGKLPPSDDMGAIADRIGVGDFADVDSDTVKALVIRISGLDGGWRNMLLPEWREFVLHGDDEDRMYARLGDGEFRVAFRLGLDYSL